MNGRYALSVLGNHFRKILGVFCGRHPAKPHNSILVGVDTDIGKGRQMFCREFRLYLRRDGRVLDKRANRRGTRGWRKI